MFSIKVESPRPLVTLLLQLLKLIKNIDLLYLLIASAIYNSLKLYNSFRIVIAVEGDGCFH